MRPTVVLTGPTGTGKSFVIEALSVGKVTGISSEKKISFTKEVNLYPLGLANVYDTPGLGDSEGRDQTFINSMVDTLVKENKGIHRVYFCIFGGEGRASSLIQTSLMTLYDMFGKPDMSLIKIVLTKMDMVEDAQEAVKEWETVLSQFCESRNWKVPAVIPVGLQKTKKGRDGFEAGFTFLESDISAVDLKKVIQTEFMKKVATIETKVEELKCDAKAARETAEEASKQQVILQAELLKEKDEKKKKELELASMHLSLTQLKAEKQAAEKEKEQALEKEKILATQLADVTQTQEKYARLLEEERAKPPRVVYEKRGGCVIS